MNVTATPAVTRPSIPRTIAKTIHLLVIAWTMFCWSAAWLGVMTAAASSPSDSRDLAVGVAATVGLGLWAGIWFVPVVAGELLAIGLSLTARDAQDTAARGRSEWRLAALLAAAPACLMAFALAMSARGAAPHEPVLSADREVADRRAAMQRAAQATGGQCDRVTGQRLLSARAGRAVWALTCDAGQNYRVTFEGDGGPTARRCDGPCVGKFSWEK